MAFSGVEASSVDEQGRDFNDISSRCGKATAFDFIALFPTAPAPKKGRSRRRASPLTDGQLAMPTAPISPRPETDSHCYLWFDLGQGAWVTDPFDAWLTDEQLIQKYGPATGKPEARK
ncbi:hypothetical protein [Caudoviricetes sp.]|nr:hypothetical protein [Caudoviricetes sp.]UOF81526.1 hypothetical protein [Caudoviricetes sp.]